MKTSLLSSCGKAFIIGISFGIGMLTTVAIGITINSTFTDTDTLTAYSLNELKDAIQNIDWNINGSGTYYTGSGNVGIGTNNPTSKLAVFGLPSGTSAADAGANGSAAGTVCITDLGNMYIDTSADTNSCD